MCFMQAPFVANWGKTRFNSVFADVTVSDAVGGGDWMGIFALPHASEE